MNVALKKEQRVRYGMLKAAIDQKIDKHVKAS